MLSVYLGDLELKKGLMCLKVCNCFAALSIKVTPVNIALFESLDHRKPQHRITKMKRCWRLKRRKVMGIFLLIKIHMLVEVLTSTA